MTLEASEYQTKYRLSREINESEVIISLPAAGYSAAGFSDGSSICARRVEFSITETYPSSRSEKRAPELSRVSAVSFPVLISKRSKTARSDGSEVFGLSINVASR